MLSGQEFDRFFSLRFSFHYILCDMGYVGDVFLAIPTLSIITCRLQVWLQVKTLHFSYTGTLLKFYRQVL